MGRRSSRAAARKASAALGMDGPGLFFPFLLLAMRLAPTPFPGHITTLSLQKLAR